MDKVLERLTGQAFTDLYARYGGGKSQPPPLRRRKAKPVSSRLTSVALPIGFTGPLRSQHAAYLEKRGFDPDFLAQEWGLESTSPTARIKSSSSTGETKEYKFSNRIFIPVMWHEAVVSFQARTTSSLVKPKYRNCPGELETYPSRAIVYRHPQCASPYGVCVEGPADVWRVGRHAFATLGINFSPDQVTCIAKLYRKVMVVYDPEPHAQKQANKMTSLLNTLGVDAWTYNLNEDRDPGDLRPDEAQKLVEQVLRRA